MADRFRTPYVPRSTGLSPYQRGSLGELIARRGDIEAQGALQSGNAWADAISRVGNIAAGAFQEYGDNKTREAEAQAKDMAERPAREMAATKTRLETEKLQREANAAVESETRKAGTAAAFGEAVKSPSRMKAFELVASDPEATKQVEEYFNRKDKAKALEFADAAAMIRRFGDSDQAIEVALESFIEDGYDKAEVAAIGEQLKDPSRRGMILDSFLKGGDETHKALIRKEVEAPKTGTFESYVIGKYGEKPTPDQQISARREWEAANDRPQDPIARELALLRLEEQKAKGATEAEGRKVMEQIPADKRLMIERVTNSLPKARREEWQSTLRNVVESGDEDELRSVIKQTAVEGEVAATRASVLGREQMVAALNDAKTVLKQLKAEGVPTGFFAGTVEDLYRKLGTSTNPKYVALANQLQETLINYRRAATGAAFSDKESSQYKSMFPNYSNQFPINEALIDGLTRAAETNNRTYWTGKVGKKQAEWLLGSGGAPSEDQPASRPGAFPVMGPDGKTYTFSSIAERDAFKKEAGIK